ncbi:MAG TPA: LTA synthase family protein, partial [Povalibacter sp.]
VQFAGLLGIGVINDLIQSAYLSLPLALYLLLMPQRWLRSKAARWMLATGSVLTLAALLFLCIAEYFFFEEFNARFNLVAFDYLMYPAEVIGDIRADYPVNAVLITAIGFGVLACWLLRQRLLAVSAPIRWPTRLMPALLHMSVVGLALLCVNTDTLSVSGNRVASELGANGLGTFFRAARTSELPYPDYYATRDTAANFDLLTSHLARAGGNLTQLAQGRLDRHFAANPHGLGRMNVVVVAEESFGAEFSRLYGSQRDLTPNFDAYARQSMWFRHMYASGTRTVRGLEAIAASFPPIPSVSILRRPNNEGIATWGSVMQKQGYQSSFLYGGYGYFDNMNYFFSKNGFEVLDRSAIDRVRFENVWGVSDEDLFDRALSYYDARHATAQPFFSIIMTTSNHKPFTFREGVPGVPAKGGGRAAGVRYADFALGYFLREARKHDWFDNTLFVVVADHGARVYGKADIPLRTYEIPMLFYAPRHLQPRTIETLTSQIDVAPTVLGLLGLEYEAPFFGTNVLACGACERIALFSHNHDVALYRNGRLAVLGLNKRMQTLSYDSASDSYRPVLRDAPLNDLAVAIYQTAYEQFAAHTYE